MALRFLFLACLVSVPIFSLSQESSKETSRVADTKPAAVVPKTVIVYVVGDVHSPTGVGITDARPTTVLKILEMAEGPNPTASLHKAKIIRKAKMLAIEIPVDLTDILSGKAPDITLQAGDILFVPRVVQQGPQPQTRISTTFPHMSRCRDSPIYIR